MIRMSKEQHLAHQARIKGARLVEPMKRGEPGNVKSTTRLGDDRGVINVREELEAARLRSKVRHSRKKPQPLKLSERVVLRGCAALLEAHPKVSLWWRQNTGATKLGSRYIKFSFVGASDLMAVMKGGIFMAVECKGTGKTLSDAQFSFLGNVTKAGGLAYCVDDPRQLAHILECV